MNLNVQVDYNRFRQIIKGKIKQNLRKYLTQGELIGKKGKDFVTIPVPQIHLPHFRYGMKQTGGVGQGDGDKGTPLGSDSDGEGGVGQAGNAAADHLLEMDVTLEELAQMLGEELELPRIEPRGKQTIESTRDRYSDIRHTGPESLRHFRRTFRNALKRQIATGIYDKDNPIIVPVREDKRYRTWKEYHIPHNNAVIIYLMDVSGSMWDEQKEIVRIETFWIDTWLRSQYKGIESRYIIHDAAAREVDRETFFHTRESGGTMISSAYRLCRDMIQRDYSPYEWNIYPFHFSDGDNWSREDSMECVKILKDEILPSVNLFCYAQVESPYGSGQFLRDLNEHFESAENMVTSQIANRDQIYDSIKTFLGKGR